MKDLFKNKPVGFWITLSCTALCLVLCVLYPVLYSGYEEYTAWSWMFPLFAVLAVGALTAVGYYSISPVALLLCILAGLGFFIYANYYYVSVVIVGIDADSFSSQFVVTLTMYLVATVAAADSVFLPQSQAKEELK